MHKNLYLVTLLLATLAGNAQLQTDSLLIEGHYRTFHFNKPEKATKNGSLLFIMHGSGGNGKKIMKATGKLEAIAASENLLIVYPDGYKNYWNECRKMSTALANKENINENAFFVGMISYFHRKYGVSEKKVFAAGFSGGGHMAYKLALTMPEKIQAIAAIVANQPDPAYSDCTEARIAVPVLIINGTRDGTNPYAGGEMYVNNNSFGIVRSTENTFHYWSKLAGYSGEPVKKTLPDIDPSDNKTIESYTFKQPNKPEIQLLKVIGGKHDYPDDIDVYLYAWDFFKSQLKEARTSSSVPVKKQIAEAACGQCKLGLHGDSCDLAVRINGKSYFVDGTDIDSHGDAHAEDGFCQTIRKVEVEGEIIDNRFKATYFKLVPAN
jgi:polyhydroxybutyrate depolymerase